MTRALALLLAATLGGCISFNPRSLRQMESALRASNPELEFESTTTFGLGPLTMDLVDFAFVHDPGVDLSKLSRADIGIYELDDRVDVAAFRMPQGTDRSCPQREVVLRVMEDDEHVELAVCMRNERLTGFSLFVLEPREMVVINARGDIEALVSAVIRDNVDRDTRRRQERADVEGAGNAGISLANEGAHIRPSS